MRRLILTLAAGALLGGSPGPAVPTARAEVPLDCTTYCGEKAAARCERIDSWACTWYILGCLAGCNLR